ncbi:MAG: hypothetical protein ACYTG7_02080 [Planctomycetota bacterium]
MPPTTGLYNLKIENTRGLSSSTLLYNYIDNISLDPIFTPFSVLGNCNVPCSKGGQKTLSISAGFGIGKKDYWIWLTMSGTYPGFNWSGQYIPLNMDPLFWWGIQTPDFPGSTGFYGTLNAGGTAVATITLPADPSGMLVGYPIHFVYVLLSKGHQPPALDVSNPVHLKYCP